MSIYDVTYRLGGLTSYVSSRQHYVGYVAIEGGFHFYDGLLSTKPVLKRYDMQRIHGDISLLVYFPLDSMNIEMGTDVKAACDMVALESPESDFLPTNNVDDAINMNLKGIPSNYELSDHFLAKALSGLEQENVYKKPLGKSYRKVRKVDSVSIISTSISCEKKMQT